MSEDERKKRAETLRWVLDRVRGLFETHLPGCTFHIGAGDFDGQGVHFKNIYAGELHILESISLAFYKEIQHRHYVECKGDGQMQNTRSHDKFKGLHLVKTDTDTRQK